MAMVGVDSGSLYRRTHSLSRLAWANLQQNWHIPFQNIVFTKLLTDERTNGRTDGRTDRSRTLCLLPVYTCVGSAAAWRRSTFIKWTGWTLAMVCHDNSTIIIIITIIIITKYQRRYMSKHMSFFQSPPRCTKCNSPSINGQCTKHCIAIWWSVALRF